MNVTANGIEYDGEPITRKVKYLFTANEIHDMALSVAGQVQDAAILEAEKKGLMAEYKGKIDTCKSVISDLSRKISDGYEEREIECSVTYHKPEQGKKTIVRSDNSQIIVEKMTSEENTLFNQQFDI